MYGNRTRNAATPRRLMTTTAAADALPLSEI
jgi:hypothetical protein